MNYCMFYYVHVQYLYINFCDNMYMYVSFNFFTVDSSCRWYWDGSYGACRNCSPCDKDVILGTSQNFSPMYECKEHKSLCPNWCSVESASRSNEGKDACPATTPSPPGRIARAPQILTCMAFSLFLYFLLCFRPPFTESSGMAVHVLNVPPAPPFLSWVITIRNYRAIAWVEHVPIGAPLVKLTPWVLPLLHPGHVTRIRILQPPSPLQVNRQR